MLFQFQTPDIFFSDTRGGDCFFPVCHYFQAAALALRYLFPGHCGVGRYDAYFQVTAGLAVTTLISRSLRGWLSQRLFPGPQQRLEQDWSDLFPGRYTWVGGYVIPRSATEIGATLISRSLWGWRLQRLFPGP